MFGPVRIAIPLLLTLQSAQTLQPPSLQEAQRELYAARFAKAAELYSNALAQDPSLGEAHYGLVKALLRAHRNKEAYAAAAAALDKSPGTPGVQTAAGLAAFRRGDLRQADEHFRAALKIDPAYPGALTGLASINGVLSKYATARQLRETAFRKRPDDPDLMLYHANTLKGAGHIEVLEKVLSIRDPMTEEAQNLRAHIAEDRSLGDRKTGVLKSPYAPAQIKLMRIQDPVQKTGMGLRVQFNGRETATMLLDTGASGVAVSPAVAKKAGLDMIGQESTQAKGIGDKTPAESHAYLATEMRVGEVVFADYPIEVFKSAGSSAFDGIIGADVFEDFIVTLDFPRVEIALTPRSQYSPNEPDEPYDASDSIAEGFFRAFRFGNHFALPTLINRKTQSLFLIDSGASDNLVDTEVGRESTKVRSDDRTRVEGIQGKVAKPGRADRAELVFAGFQQNNLDLLAIPLEKASDGMGVALGGILGMPILQQLKVTLDYREGTIRLEYRK